MGILKDGGITFILWMLPIRLINSAGDECTTVRDVSVVRGGTAELLCHIKHEKNDPSKTTKYRKIWTQVKPYVWTTVYWYEILDGNQIDYDATVPGTGYLGRTVRKSGSHDVVQLSKITDQDYGTYRCGWSVTPKVDGCAGAEASFNVTLLEPISNAHVSASSPKKEGESTVFTCSASGTSPITYTLHKVSGVTSGDRWSNASGVFTLSKIQRADAGEYRCTADNEAKRPQTSDAVTLEVYYAPRSLSLSYSPPPEATQPEKSQVTLTCTADGGHPAPDVTIYRQGVSRASGKSTATLTITLTKSDNQVALVCKATSAGITGQMSNEIKYNVQLQPAGVSITQSPTSGVVVNTDVTLTCKTSSSSNPPVSLGWTRDGSTVTDGVTHATEDGDHNAKVSTSQLRFRAQKQNNGNVYVCRVTAMTHLTDQTKLNVMFPPGDNNIVESPPGSVTVGTQKSLTCTTDSANPHAEITWMRDGQPVSDHVVTTNPDGQYKARKTSSIITITTTRDHNGAEYACAVKYRSNEINNLKRTAKLDVSFAPVGVRMTQSVDSDGTSGKGSPVSVNSDVTLTCKTSSSSNPPVSLGWTRDGSTVTDGVTPGTEDGDHNAKVSTSQLRFRAQKQNNGNVYVCRVTTMTHLTDQTTLNVTSAPDRPTQPGIAYLSVLSVTLRWTAGFNGGFRQTFSVMYRVAGRTWPDEAQITGIPDPGENRAVQYKVGNLTQNTTYEFRVRAENERENGERTSHYTVTIQGKTKGKPTVVGNSLTVVRKPKSPMANASWAEPHGAFSAISISVCETSSESCRQHAVNTAVSNTTTLIRELHADKTYTYILQLYDNGDLVYSSQKAKSSFPNEPDNNPNHVFGALGGLLAVAVVVIVVLSLVVMVLWRRKSNHQVVGETLEQSHMYENTSFTRGNLEAMPSEKGGVLYENVKMMNSKTQETLDQLDAHNRARSRVITRDLSDGKSNNEIDGNQYEQLRIPRDQNVPEVEVYSQLQMMT